MAALQLGLKRMFKGKIDHLHTTIHEEPLPDSSFKRKYLVLYDTHSRGNRLSQTVDAFQGAVAGGAGACPGIASIPAHATNNRTRMVVIAVYTHIGTAIQWLIRPGIRGN